MLRVLGRMTKRKFVSMFLLEMIEVDHVTIKIKVLKFIFRQSEEMVSSLKYFKA
jgi:hypothetical protein